MRAGLLARAGRALERPRTLRPQLRRVSLGSPNGMVQRILIGAGLVTALSCTAATLRTRDGTPTQVRPLGCYTVHVAEWTKSAERIEFPKRIAVSPGRPFRDPAPSQYEYALHRADGRPMDFASGRWWITESHDTVVFEWGMHNPEGFDGVVLRLARDGSGFAGTADSYSTMGARITTSVIVRAIACSAPIPRFFGTCVSRAAPPFPQAPAVACAETFIADQGYTAQPARVDSLTIVYETRDEPGPWEAILARRRNSLAPRAAGYCSDGLVVFASPAETAQSSGTAVSFTRARDSLWVFPLRFIMAKLDDTTSGCVRLP